MVICPQRQGGSSPCLLDRSEASAVLVSFLSSQPRLWRRFSVALGVRGK